MKKNNAMQVIEKLDGTKDKEMKGIIPVLTEHNFMLSDYYSFN